MCTHFHLKTRDNNIVVGRTMDYGLSFKPNFLIKKSTKNTYGYIGISVTVLNIDFIKKISTDGMNEKGLSAGFLYMPGTRYSSYDKSNPNNNILFFELCDWVLAHCQDIPDVKEKLPKKNIFSPEILQPFEESVLPLYLALTDKNGNSAVVEFFNGEISIIDNPVGVSTNEPTLSWHLKNIEQYQNLDSKNPSSYPVVNYKTSHIPDGLGMKNIPGDMTPASRFIKTVYSKHFSTKLENNEAAYNTASHIINSLDVPIGFTVTSKSKLIGNLIQRWSVIKGLNSGLYAVRTYDNPSYTAININDYNLKNMQEDILIPVEETPLFRNIKIN